MVARTPQSQGSLGHLSALLQLCFILMEIRTNVLRLKMQSMQMGPLFKCMWPVPNCRIIGLPQFYDPTSNQCNGQNNQRFNFNPDFTTPIRVAGTDFCLTAGSEYCVIYELDSWNAHNLSLRSKVLLLDPQ